MNGTRRNFRRCNAQPWAVGGARLEIAALAVLGALLLMAACAGTTGADVEVTRAHQVQAGESLWSLASEARMPGQTTEQAVESIAELNDIRDGRIAAGSVIEVPVSSSSLGTAQAMR